MRGRATVGVNARVACVQMTLVEQGPAGIGLPVVKLMVTGVETPAAELDRDKVGVDPKRPGVTSTPRATCVCGYGYVRVWTFMLVCLECCACGFVYLCAPTTPLLGPFVCRRCLSS